jgi:hypothetical protein
LCTARFCSHFPSTLELKLDSLRIGFFKRALEVCRYPFLKVAIVLVGSVNGAGATVKSATTNQILLCHVLFLNWNHGEDKQKAIALCAISQKEKNTRNPYPS